MFLRDRDTALDMLTRTKRSDFGGLVWLLVVCVLVTVLCYCVLSQFFLAFSPPVTVTPKSMNTKRTGHSATLLQDGRVLIVGGVRPNPFGARIAEIDLFEPDTGVFHSVGTLSSGLFYHHAVLLQDGNVFISGWYTDGNDGFHIFDPVKNTLKRKIEAHLGRSDSSATLLQNGKVLIVGGFLHNDPVSSAVLFDPVSHTVLNTGSLLTSNRAFHTATMLPNGNVLIIGGTNGITPRTKCGHRCALGTIEMYDSSTEKFSPFGDITPNKALHSAVLLQNGKILVSGGDMLNEFPWKETSSELCDTITRTCRKTAPMQTARRQHTATLLPNGKIFITGGISVVRLDSDRTQFTVLQTCELYDPAAETYTFTANMSFPRKHHTATLLQNGMVLITGGVTQNQVLSSAEIYDPSTEAFLGR